MELATDCSSRSLLIRCFAVFLLLCVTFGLFAQNPPSLRELKKVFKSAMQRDKKTHSFSNPWIICNEDSSFFKSENIQLVSDENYAYFKSDCCAFVSWTFLSKNRFSQSLDQVCREPASIQVLSPNDIYTLKIVKERSFLVLQTKNPLNKMDKYRVNSMERIVTGVNHQLAFIISLQRLK